MVEYHRWIPAFAGMTAQENAPIVRYTPCKSQEKGTAKSMFDDLIHRRQGSSIWRKIPWHDADFSRRMLREHLTQDHDLASRRLSMIDQHVAWIHDSVLGGRQSSILDLGCGPGLYTHRFVNLGHSCVGLDFSPASIAYALEHHAGNFVLADMETGEYGAGYDLICLIYGELNAFSFQSARHIVEKAHRALKPGGKLLLEVSRYEAIRRIGQEPRTWYTAEQGLFSEDPHIVLQEFSFENNHSNSWHYVIDAKSGALHQYVSMHQAYTEDEYRRLLHCFTKLAFHPSLAGELHASGEMFVIVAEK
jgi:SAM-dependent methyltransferase